MKAGPSQKRHRALGEAALLAGQPSTRAGDVADFPPGHGCQGVCQREALTCLSAELRPLVSLSPISVRVTVSPSALTAGEVHNPWSSTNTHHSCSLSLDDKTDLESRCALPQSPRTGEKCQASAGQPRNPVSAHPGLRISETKTSPAFAFERMIPPTFDPASRLRAPPRLLPLAPDLGSLRGRQGGGKWVRRPPGPVRLPARAVRPTRCM